MDIYLDPSGHTPVVTDGDLVMVSDRREVVQLAKIKLLTILGEDTLDPDLGLIDIENWYTKAPSLARIRNSIRAQMLTVPGVLTIDTVDLSPLTSTRQLLVSITGTATDGTFEVSTVASVP